MTDKFQLMMAGLAALALGAFIPLPAFATDDAHPSLLTNLIGPGAAGSSDAPRQAPGVAPGPQRTQIVDSVQSTNSASSASASASASASSSVTVTADRKQGKCKAEASAHAQADGIEDSDHDLKVVEGDGCSAKAESSATVKPQQKLQSE